jgi:DNA invertase Pin-like site-specific DNA recombinase
MFNNDVVEEFSLAIGLVRRSTDEYRQEHSIDSQKIQIEDCCERSRVRIDKKFNPSGAPNLAGFVSRDGSGLSFDREDFDIAIKYCKDNGVKQIVVASLDRLSREETTEFTRRLEALRNASIDLLIATELPVRYDLSKRSVRNDLIERAKFSHETSVQTARNVLRGLKNKAYQMQIPPRQTFGFRVIKNPKKMFGGKIDNSDWKVEPIEKELQALRKVGLMFINGSTTTEMIDYLVENQIKIKSRYYPEGNTFCWNALKALLKNPIYKGDYVKFRYKSGKIFTAGAGFGIEEFNRHRKKGSETNFKNRMEVQPEENWTCRTLAEQVAGEYRYLKPVAIFTEEEFEQIQDRFRAKHKKVKSRETLRKYDFTGFGKCSHCGASLLGNKREGDNSVFYYCQRNRFSGLSGCSTAGGKNIDQKQLLHDLLLGYYLVCAFNPQAVLESAIEKQKELSLSPDGQKVRLKIQGWKDFRDDLIDKGKFGSAEFRNAEMKIEDAERELQQLSVPVKYEVKKYKHDGLSLTKHIVEALEKNGDGREELLKFIHLKAIGNFHQIPIWFGGNRIKNSPDSRLAKSLDEFVNSTSRDFVEDILQSFEIEWHPKPKGHISEVKKIRFNFKLGFSIELEHELGYRAAFKSGGLWKKSSAVGIAHIEKIEQLIGQVKTSDSLLKSKTPR